MFISDTCLAIHHYIMSGTLKQKSVQYSFEHEVVFKAENHLSALGWPLEGFEDLSECQIKSLVGEGLSAPWIATVIYAYFLNPYAPWWAKKATETEEDKSRLF
jgi:hypothetical protein